MLFSSVLEKTWGYLEGGAITPSPDRPAGVSGRFLLSNRARDQATLGSQYVLMIQISPGSPVINVTRLLLVTTEGIIDLSKTSRVVSCLSTFMIL